MITEGADFISSCVWIFDKTLQTSLAAGVPFGRNALLLIQTLLYVYTLKLISLDVHYRRSFWPVHSNGCNKPMWTLSPETTASREHPNHVFCFVSTSVHRSHCHIWTDHLSWFSRPDAALYRRRDHETSIVQSKTKIARQSP